MAAVIALMVGCAQAPPARTPVRPSGNEAARPTQPEPMVPAPELPAPRANAPDAQALGQAPVREAPAESAWTDNTTLQRRLDELRAATGTDLLVRSWTFGTSAGGVPLRAVHLSSGAGNGMRPPVVLLVAQQRGDEPAGAEALLTFVQAIAAGGARDALAKVDLLVVPRLNPDGAATGAALNAAGIDVARDHLLLHSPEARALAGLVRDADPAVVVNLRDFDAGPARWARFGGPPISDIMFGHGTGPEMAPFVARAASEWFLRPVAADLAQVGLSYEPLVLPRTDAPGAVLEMGGAAPDTLVNVQGLRNSVGLVVAVRSAAPAHGADLERRVQSFAVAIDRLLAAAAARADDLQRVRRYVSAETVAKACRGSVLVDAQPMRTRYDIVLRDPATGQARHRQVELESVLELQIGAGRPRPCGYWIAADELPAVERLQALGLRVVRLAFGSAALGAVLSDGASAAPDALLELPTGSFYVSLEQPLANLATAALEPGTPFGFIAHGLIGSPRHVARVRRPL